MDGSVMGYFPNGDAGMWYEETYCTKCHHYGEEDGGCPVYLAHLLYNYEACNNKDSILHLLIPRDEKGNNKECAMFIPRMGNLPDKPKP